MPVSFRFSGIRENPVAATVQLLSRLKVQVTETTITKVLNEHPDYPSLLSISDGLRQWQIDNICLKLEPDRLDELPLPFIAHLKIGNGQFVTVTQITADEIDYILSEQGKRTVSKSRDAFLKEWSGVVLVAEPTSKSGEKEYAISRKKELFRSFKISFTIMICLLMAGIYFIFIGYDLSVLMLLLIKLGGSIITAFLLGYEIDQSNPVLQKLCSIGTKTNCNAVLKSKGAKLFGRLSWSEIGFFYFSGTFLSIILGANRELSLFILAWFNLLALPYIVFSIYYQWRIVRQWCLLCLTVQILLVLEFIDFIFRGYSVSFSGMNGSALVNMIVVFLAPIFCWSFIKTILIRARSTKQAEIELRRLKHDSQVFETLLTKQKTLAHIPEGLGITLGNINATTTLIQVCNPYCEPCAKAHSIIDDLLEEYENLKVRIIFTATDNETDPRAEPVKHLMALYEKRDKQLIKKALTDWYSSGKKNYRAFAKEYPLNGEWQFQGDKLKAMYEWCRDAEITSTPAIFINGHQLPNIYTVTDLKYFLSV